MTERPIRSLCVTAHSDRPEAETFIGLKRRGIHIRVRSAPGAPHCQRLVDAGVRIEPLEFAHKLDPTAIKILRREIDEWQPDILHVFNNTAVTNGLVAARGRKLKIVAYRGIVGNVSFLNPVSWMRYLNPRVDRIVCVAEAIRRHFLDMRLLGYRMPRDKPVTIYKGHHLSWYTDPPADLRDLGIPERACVIGCVANWRPRKGVEVLIEACRSLPADAPIHLVLVGNMEDPGLMANIDRSPMRERIHVVGYRSDAPAVIAACDIAVLPSIKREGLPKTVIEAMAYGVPPVVTDCGGSRELVVDGRSGLVVPVRNAVALAAALTRLYEDPQLRVRLGRAARERIRVDFRIEDTIERTLALYRTLVPAPGRPARAEAHARADHG